MYLNIILKYLVFGIPTIQLRVRLEEEELIALGKRTIVQESQVVFAFKFVYLTIILSKMVSGISTVQLKFEFFIFSSPCRSPSELLPSLGVRRRR